MAIIITHTPSDIELAYGPVIVSTTSDDNSSQTMAIRIIDAISSDVVAEFRQEPNPVGYAHFDISKILQRQVTSNKDLNGISILGDSVDEVFGYDIEYGSISAVNSTFIIDGTVTDKRVINGRKTFTEVDWDSTTYIPEFNIFGGVNNSIVSFGTPLTDRNYNNILGSSITDYKPAYVGATDTVLVADKEIDDSYTLSYFNQYTGLPLSTYNGINGFTVTICDNNALLQEYNYNNVADNNGGPNINPVDAIQPISDNTCISISCGSNNPDVALHPTATHIYVTPWAYTLNPNTSTTSKIYPYNHSRINIDNGDCMDYDPIQVSWINSFGFRDYFTFTKKNELTTNIERNTFNRTFSSFSASTYTPVLSDRGTVVYAQSVSEVYTAATKYLTDNESTYLKNLYVSGNVMVRFNGSSDWLPVILKSNSYKQKTFRKDSLFQHDITFEMANKIQVQNG